VDGDNSMNNPIIVEGIPYENIKRLKITKYTIKRTKFVVFRQDPRWIHIWRVSNGNFIMENKDLNFRHTDFSNDKDFENAAICAFRKAKNK
jgi:hypothetical protein